MGTETESELRDRIPEWANAVLCPRCRQLMTPIRAKKASDQWGVSITLQCHAADGPKRCLVVSQVTTSVQSMLVAEDFGEFDFDWRKVQPSQGDSKATESLEVPSTPPDPFTRLHAKHAAWIAFWASVDPNGYVSRDAVMTEVRGMVKSSTTLEKVPAVLSSLPRWMKEHTGLRFVASGNEGWQYVGKSEGNPTLAPYSDPEYRERYGLS